MAQPTPPTPHRPRRPSLPCLGDATTLAGLAYLRRRRPRDWHEVMRAALPTIGPNPTVAQALRGGGFGELLPCTSSAREANRLKKPRHCARRVIALYGNVVLGEIDDAWLFRERRRIHRKVTISGDVASACFTLLRKIAHTAQAKARQVQVRRRRLPGRRYWIDPPTERPPAIWGDVELMMWNASPRVRAALALQAHMGVSPGRVLGLRVCDVDVITGEVRVDIPGRCGPEQACYAIPVDALGAVKPWLRKRRRHGSRALLFPQRGCPERLTRSLNRAIRRDADALEVPAPTMQQVRRLAQTGLRHLGATRAQVRGSARRAAVGRSVGDRELRRQQHEWTFQIGAGDLPPSRRAPRSCASDEPELGRPQRRRPRTDIRPDAPFRRRGASPDLDESGARQEPAPTMPPEPLPDFAGWAPSFSGFPPASASLPPKLLAPQKGYNQKDLVVALMCGGLLGFMAHPLIVDAIERSPESAQQAAVGLAEQLARNNAG